MRVAGMVAGGAALVVSAHMRRATCEKSPLYRERLAKTTTMHRLQTYETVHGDVSNAQKQRLYDALFELARVVAPSAMNKLTVELVGTDDDVSVSFRVAPVDPEFRRPADQVKEMLAAVAGAAPNDKAHMRLADYGISDGAHTTRLRTDTGARVELRVETASGKTTLTLVTADFKTADAARIEAAYRASL